MSALRILLAVAGLVLFAIGLFHLLLGPPEIAPVTAAIADFRPHSVSDTPLTLTGARIDLARAVIRFDGTEPALAILPVTAPGKESEPAPAALITADKDVLARFARGAKTGGRYLERDARGVVLDPAEARRRYGTELARLEGELMENAPILVEGTPAPPRGGYLALVLGSIALLTVMVLSLSSPAATANPSLVGTAKTKSAPAAMTKVPPSMRDVLPAPGSSGPAALSDVDERLYPAEPLFAEPLLDSGVSPFEDEPRRPTTKLPLRPAAPAVAPPSPIDEALIKRRLIEYSSFALSSPDELLKQFRFVAAKVMADDESLRIVYHAARPHEAKWEQATKLEVYRCPEIDPWASMLVAELELGGRPVRLVTRTVLDLGALADGRVKSGHELLRALLKELILRSPALAVDEKSRAFVVSGKEPAALPSLRLLAERDARWV